MLRTLSITRTQESRLSEELRETAEFGCVFSDHMLLAEYEDGKWTEPRIVPYGPMPFSPSMSVFHYGQSVFEGFKAHRTPDGGIALFRHRDNYARLNRSAARLAMPEVPEEMFFDGIAELVRLDREWAPHRDGGALYVRPLYFGIDETLFVRPARRYRLVVFTCPVGPYFSHPIRLLAEEHFVRAAPGGTGDVKASGNYAGGLLAARLAQDHGFHNVLWLDSTSHSFVEEVGVMNVFFVSGGVAITPPLAGTILPGVTRDSVITLLREIDVPVQEKRISIDEVFEAAATGRLTEAFGAGTAAIVAPIQSISYRGREITLPPDHKESVGSSIRERLQAIQTGRETDTHGWLTRL
jgi:branched-chain amino acid aminotransferase